MEEKQEKKKKAGAKSAKPKATAKPKAKAVKNASTSESPAAVETPIVATPEEAAATAFTVPEQATPVWDDVMLQLEEQKKAISAMQASIGDLSACLNVLNIQLPSYKSAITDNHKHVVELHQRIDALDVRVDTIGHDMADNADSLRKQIQRVDAKIENPKSTVIEYTYDKEQSFVLPEPARVGSIGDDIVLTKDVHVPHGRSVIPINLILNLPMFVEAKIEARSGFSLKGILGIVTKLIPEKFLGITYSVTAIEDEDRVDADVKPGKVDPGYHDKVGIIIINRSVPFTIKAGTHIAQITYYQTLDHRYKKVDSVESFTPHCPNRGGGWGHSDETPAQQVPINNK